MKRRNSIFKYKEAVKRIPAFTLTFILLTAASAQAANECKVSSGWSAWTISSTKGVSVQVRDFDQMIGAMHDLVDSGRCSNPEYLAKRFSEIRGAVNSSQAADKIKLGIFSDDERMKCSKTLLDEAEKFRLMSAELKMNYALATGKSYDPQHTSFLFGGITATGCLVGAAVTVDTLLVGAPAGALICAGSTVVGFLTNRAIDHSHNNKQIMPGAQSAADELDLKIAVADTVMRDRLAVYVNVYAEPTEYQEQANETEDILLRDKYGITQAQYGNAGSYMRNAPAAGLDLKSHDWKLVVQKSFGSCDGSVLPTTTDLISAIALGSLR